jgi:regulatory protein
MPATDTPRAIRTQAIRLLARREHSRRELSRKLSGAEPQVLTAVLDQLQTEGLLSDQRFAEQMVHQRAQKGQGPLRIQADLAARGVDNTIIATALDTANIDWAEQLATVAARKQQGASCDRPAQARLGRFLLTRGFPESMVRRYLQQLR